MAVMHNSRTWVGRALGVALAFLPLRGAMAQGGPLAYTHTGFIHGFASGPGIWTAHRPELGASTQAYLASRVPLGRVLLPAYPVMARYPEAVANVSKYVFYGNGRHVLVGHSLGALAARGAYLGLPVPGVSADQAAAVRTGIAAIVAVAAPHQGAPIAANAGAAKGMLLDMQRRVNDALGVARVPASIYAALAGASMTPGSPAGLLAGVAAYVLIDQKLAGQSVSVDDLARLTEVPVLVDLKPTAEAIRQLNASTADATLPRVNLRGEVPTEDVLLRLQSAYSGRSLRESQDLLNQAKLLFRACKAGGYMTLIYARSARRCGFALRVLGRMDREWTRYAMGGASGGFDGVVPHAHSRYPGGGVAYEPEPLAQQTHFSMYQSAAGAEAIRIGLQRIRMEGALPEPPQRPGNALSASLVEPVNYVARTPISLRAVVTGGVYPFTYAWDARHATESAPRRVGTGEAPKIILPYTGTYTLTLTVGDGFGGRTVVTRTITAVEPQTCQPVVFGQGTLVPSDTTDVPTIICPPGESPASTLRATTARATPPIRP